MGGVYVRCMLGVYVVVCGRSGGGHPPSHVCMYVKGRQKQNVTSQRVDAWQDGGTDGKEGWEDGWMDGWMDGRPRMSECMHAWMDG